MQFSYRSYGREKGAILIMAECIRSSKVVKCGLIFPQRITKFKFSCIRLHKTLIIRTIVIGIAVGVVEELLVII